MVESVWRSAALWPHARRGRVTSRSASSTFRSRCFRRPTPAPRSASTSFTPSARRAFSRSAGARSASARCRTPTSSRATNSRKGRYVVVGDEDIEKVRVDSTRVINLEKFTDDTAIDPIYLERPYYLAPDGAVAKEAFAVIREGMKGKAGIGKVALYGREYLVKVQPRERGLIMYTLRHANEIRSMDAIDELGPARQGQAERGQAGAAGHRHVRGRRRFRVVSRRLSGGAARDHRREDRRPRDRDAGGRGAAEGRQPDGGAPQEPRFDQLDEEEVGRARAPPIGKVERMAPKKRAPGLDAHSIKVRSLLHFLPQRSLASLRCKSAAPRFSFLPRWRVAAARPRICSRSRSIRTTPSNPGTRCSSSTPTSSRAAPRRPRAGCFRTTISSTSPRKSPTASPSISRPGSTSRRRRTCRASARSSPAGTSARGSAFRTRRAFRSR